MSFFGFDNRHNAAAPGFSQAHDPFAGLSRQDDEDDALEFEDTYDGLGDQLDETGDAFNDETFGGGGGDITSAPVGKDFDFFGQTAKVADAIEEEHVRFDRRQPAPKAAQKPAPTSFDTSSYQYSAPPITSKPARSGYEKYGDEPVGELQVDAALWGVAPKKHPAAAPAAAPAAPQPAGPFASGPGRKMLSLEEVEAAMRAQSKKPSTPAAAPALEPPEHQAAYESAYQFSQAEQAFHHTAQASVPEAARSQESSLHHSHGHPITILQRPQSKHTPPAAAPSPQQIQQPVQPSPQPIQPTQILQNPNRLSGDASRIGAAGQQFPSQPTHRQQGSLSQQPHFITHPSQLAHLSEEEKAVYMEQEAKRAKRNHKIFLMSRDNGLMTPQDKNFVTRIQLQQLVSATGNPNEHGTDDSLTEDFYYQVHSQIQGGHRQNPNQPLNNFAQTYLFQTGSRQGGVRRHNRGPENHMQRMEQQVQRAVEAAKNRPKNKQLVIEGSLGKISFSNAKTPKPLLNIKRQESAPEVQRPSSANRAHATLSPVDRKSVLRSIEKVYDLLMKMEDHGRVMPPPPSSETDTEGIQQVVSWQAEADKMNAQLWNALKVHEPIGVYPVHPFMAFLSYPKGSKAIPRVFRQINHEQRTTILTMIIVHLDKLDVVRGAQYTDDMRLNSAMRESIQLFSDVVVSTLFNFMSELDLNIITGVLGLISGMNVDLIAKTRVGVVLLTSILSRGEIIKHQGAGSEQAWQSWDGTYTNFFNVLEPTLPHIFPGTVNSGDDIYVWQLLAALGIGANPDQQQRLVLGVKDRVMETVTLAKTLPREMASQRLDAVNLFMRAIGLDVELLQ